MIYCDLTIGAEQREGARVAVLECVPRYRHREEVVTEARREGLRGEVYILRDLYL